MKVVNQVYPTFDQLIPVAQDPPRLIHRNQRVNIADQQRLRLHGGSLLSLSRESLV